MVDKAQIEAAAEHCEKEAEMAFERGLSWCEMGGPQSAIADFEKAGALTVAAQELRKRKA